MIGVRFVTAATAAAIVSGDGQVAVVGRVVLRDGDALAAACSSAYADISSAAS